MAVFNLVEEHGVAEVESRMLAFLNSLAGVDSLERIWFSAGATLTAAVAHAVARCVPKLAYLDLHSRAPAEPDAQQPAGNSADVGAPAAARVLLQLVGPRLKTLSLTVSGSGYWPARALEPLALCAALTSLHLHTDWHGAKEEYALGAESSLLRTLSSLTSLRQLTLRGGASPASDPAARQARAAAIESGLSPLTALTSLNIHLRCLDHEEHPDPVARGVHPEDLELELSVLRSLERHEEAAQLLSAVAAESRALGAALRCMLQLTELRTPARLNTSGLASLTALTYLRVGALVLPPPPPADDPAAPAVPPVYDMPPQLKLFKSYAGLPVHVAASLRRSPAAVSAGAGPISWEAPGLLGYGDQPYWTLAFQDGDIDGEGRLTAEAAATMSKAVTSVKAAFWLPPASAPGFGEIWFCLCVAGKHKWHVKPPPVLEAETAANEAAAVDGAGAVAAAAAPPAGDGSDGTHCGSWLGAIAAKLRPMELQIWGFAFSARDVRSMTMCLTGLKELSLRGCRYSLSALPLLGGMAALEGLTLGSADWVWPYDTPEVYMRNVVEGAFLALTAPAAGPHPARWLDKEERAALVADAEALYGCKAALPLPSLERLVVFCRADAENDWVRQGLAVATAELRKRRTQPTELIIEELE